MTGEQYKSLIDFDLRLTIGQDVYFRFTNCGKYHKVKVKIFKINKKSVIGEGLEEQSGYPKGFKFKVPRITDIANWTCNNCIEHPDMITQQAPRAITK